MLNIVFAGNVGGDVTLREVTVRDEQIKVASFSVAVDNGKNVDGEDIPPTWIRVSVWRGYADVVAQFVNPNAVALILLSCIDTISFCECDTEGFDSVLVIVGCRGCCGQVIRDPTTRCVCPQHLSRYSDLSESEIMIIIVILFHLKFDSILVRSQ